MVILHLNRDISVGKDECLNSNYYFPVNGNRGQWASYEECSVSCGSGMQTKTRSCNDPAPEHNGNPCYGLGTSSRICTMEACKGKTSFKFFFYSFCAWLCFLNSIIIDFKATPYTS